MLEINTLKLVVNSNETRFETNVSFEAGLNLIVAPNSSGKSTCMQAILYGLGLEGMLSPSRAVPLPHAMTSEIDDDTTGQSFTVTSSWVELEISSGERQAHVRRSVHSLEIDQRVVTVSENGVQRDLYVRDKGAATSEHGYQRWLAEFIGWRQPLVATTAGQVVPLYLEAVFPLLFVEQKHGWAGVASSFPNYLRIRNAPQRAIEFVLSLDSSDYELKAQMLRDERASIESEWSTLAGKVSGLAASARVSLPVPSRPEAGWVLDPPSQGSVMSGGNTWTTIDERTNQLRQVIVESSEPRTAGDASEELAAVLQESQADLAVVESAYAAIVVELEQDRRQQDRLSGRVESVRQDHRRVGEANRLARLGGKTPTGVQDESPCPVCTQIIPPTLVHDLHIEAASLDDQLARLAAELQLIEAMATDTDAAIEVKLLELGGLDQHAMDLRRTIRVAKETLLSPDNQASAAQIEERLRARQELEQLELFSATVNGMASTFEELAARWADVRVRLAALGATALSPFDVTKLDALEELLREMLRDFDFGSMSPDEISISEDRYTPTHEGFDLGFDLSASDMIRTIWSYLLSLMVVSDRFSGNHPGLLVFDEPRQQSADKVSFGALIRRAARVAERGQIIFATSEGAEDLDVMLDGVPHAATAFTGNVLRRCES